MVYLKKLLLLLKKSIESLQEEKSFIVFGTGKFALDGFYFFSERNVEIKCFIDNDYRKHGVFLGKNVYGIEYLNDVDEPLVILSSWAGEILKQLNDIKYKGRVYVVDPWFSIFNEFFLDDEKIEEVVCFYGSLDEGSRNVLCGILEFRLGKSKSLFISDYKQYFNPAMSFNSLDVIIDGGAYIGDTVLSFNDTCVKEFHCFEPEIVNFKSLCTINSCNKVHAVNMGLWSKDDFLNFSSSNESASYGCKIENDGDTVVKVTSIDSYCEINKVSPTIIKMDIEGAERDAISGAINVIMNYKPKLAISVYHKYDDIWEIPKIISKIRPDYKFYLGHHTDGWMETILYAV